MLIRHHKSHRRELFYRGKWMTEKLAPSTRIEKMEKHHKGSAVPKEVKCKMQIGAGEVAKGRLSEMNGVRSRGLLGIRMLTYWLLMSSKRLRELVK